MRFKFYILISLLIHLIIFTFSPFNFRKERLKGEKIIPIEIFNNESYNSSKGNANRNSPKKMPQITQDKRKEVIKKVSKSKMNKDLKLKDTNENLTGNFKLRENEIKEENNLKEDKKTLIKEKKLDIAKISNPQIKGFGYKDNKENIERGSIKGKGKLKITCLNCISPKYPRKALKKGLEGKLTVKVWILKSGDVEKAEIIISSGITSIDKAALEAAKNSKFYPIELNSFLNIQYDLKIN